MRLMRWPSGFPEGLGQDLARLQAIRLESLSPVKGDPKMARVDVTRPKGDLKTASDSPNTTGASPKPKISRAVNGGRFVLVNDRVTSRRHLVGSRDPGLVKTGPSALI